MNVIIAIHKSWKHRRVNTFRCSSQYKPDRMRLIVLLDTGGEKLGKNICVVLCSKGTVFLEHNNTTQHKYSFLSLGTVYI